jgi:hypothetical protein
MTVPQRIPWTEVEPSALARECSAVPAIAPDLEWFEHDGAFGWRGVAPVWPFDRPAPEHLMDYVGDRRFRILVVYSAAHPAAPPKIYPVDPEPEPLTRTQHRWHVNGDGSLCLLQSADDWQPTASAAELIVKAAGWFLEYLLMVDMRIEEMTTSGISTDLVHDDLLDGAST